MREKIIVKMDKRKKVRGKRNKKKLYNEMREKIYKKNIFKMREKDE